jgi:DNA polymerase III epsilon subunit-like protein
MISELESAFWSEEGDKVKTVFLDTETTGFEPGNVVQLSYVIVDKQHEPVAQNFWFAVDYVEPGAERIHGMSVEILRQLSGGQVFADVSGIVARDLSDSLLITHNVAFDRRFLETELQRCQRAWPARETFCTMQHFTPILRLPGNYGYKWPRLEELMGYLHISAEDVQEKALQLFGTDAVGAHDARFDCTAVLECYQASVSAGLLLPR